MRGTVILCCLSVGLSACASSHQTRGLVLRVDPASSTMTVSHDAIPGYMDAMVMPFAVRDPRELEDLSPGDVVSFRLRPRRDGSTIDRIKHRSASAKDSGLTMTPSVASLVRIGDPVPDFSLVDQHGSTVTLAALRGRVIAVTFIYSRCPLPDYCPLVVANLAQVRDRYRDRLGRDLVLLTVSFDPKYDTPDVLRSYAARYGGNIPGWHFLTGSPEEIAAVCASFGIEYWPDQGLITHTLQTAVVDREGRLAASVEGRGFSARQVADLVGSVLDR